MACPGPAQIFDALRLRTEDFQPVNSGHPIRNTSSMATALSWMSRAVHYRQSRLSRLGPITPIPASNAISYTSCQADNPPRCPSCTVLLDSDRAPSLPSLSSTLQHRDLAPQQIRSSFTSPHRSYKEVVERSVFFLRLWHPINLFSDLCSAARTCTRFQAVHSCCWRRVSRP